MQLDLRKDKAVMAKASDHCLAQVAEVASGTRGSHSYPKSPAKDCRFCVNWSIPGLSQHNPTSWDKSWKSAQPQTLLWSSHALLPAPSPPLVLPHQKPSEVRLNVMEKVHHTLECRSPWSSLSLLLKNHTSFTDCVEVGLALQWWHTNYRDLRGQKTEDNMEVKYCKNATWCTQNCN